MSRREDAKAACLRALEDAGRAIPLVEVAERAGLGRKQADRALCALEATGKAERRYSSRGNGWARCLDSRG